MVREAFGSGSDTDGSGKDEEKHKTIKKKKKRVGLDGEINDSGSESAHSSDYDGKLAM